MRKINILLKGAVYIDFEGKNVRYGKAILVRETGDIFTRRIDCARALGVSNSNVTACISGITKTCGGYHLDLIDYNPPVDLNPDEWREHPRYSGVYISRDGEAVSYKSGKPYQLRKIIEPTGYISYSVGHAVTEFAHRLVAETYIPNPHSKLTVNHIDGDRQNNSVDNLEWNTYSENIRHSYSSGFNHSHLRKVRVMETDMVFESVRDCATAMNIDARRISDCLNGRCDNYKGYHFEDVI